MKNRTKAVLLTAGLSLLTASFLFIAVSLGSDLLPAFQVGRWPTVEARVTESGVAYGCERGGYRPAVRYRYVVDGKPHEGRRLIIGDSPCGSRDYARDFAARYPVDGVIRVRVNPANASDAVATAEVNWSTVGGMLLMLALFLFMGRSTLLCFRTLRGE